MTFADFVGSGSTGVIGAINTVIVPIIFVLAFLIFVWGMVKYFFIHGDSETSREEGRYFAVWGVIGMVILFAIWGIVNILLSTLGITP